MKIKHSIILAVVIVLSSSQLNAQKVYPITSGEMIFSQSQSSFTSAFTTQYPTARVAAGNVRYTVFLHIGQYIHYDMNNSFGLYTGLAIRNVGMITDETLPQTVSISNGAAVPYSDYNIIRRQYMLGVPLAIKLGSFSNNFYIFGGGEYEMAFHLKEKYWTNTFDRSGSKTKSTQWFSSQTPTFMPSVFAGIQFPGGVNVKFKYYLNNFLNHDYKLSSNSQDGAAFSISDQTRYQESQVFYVSLCWQFNTASLWKDE